MCEEERQRVGKVVRRKREMKGRRRRERKKWLFSFFISRSDIYCLLLEWVVAIILSLKGFLVSDPEQESKKTNKRG